MKSAYNHWFSRLYLDDCQKSELIVKVKNAKADSLNQKVRLKKQYFRLIPAACTFAVVAAALIVYRQISSRPVLPSAEITGSSCSISDTASTAAVQTEAAADSAAAEESGSSSTASSAVNTQPAETKRTPATTKKFESTVSTAVTAVPGKFVEINEIPSVMVPSPLKFPDGYYQEDWTEERFIGYLGRDPKPKWVPDGMTRYTGPHILYFDKDGNVLFYRYGYTYRENLNDYTSKSLEVNVAKGQKAYNDVIYPAAAQVKSSINGVSMFIGHANLKGKDLYLAEFSYQNIGYYIEGESGVTQDEFIKIIESIVG